MLSHAARRNGQGSRLVELGSQTGDVRGVLLHGRVSAALQGVVGTRARHVDAQGEGLSQGEAVLRADESRFGVVRSLYEGGARDEDEIREPVGE